MFTAFQNKKHGLALIAALAIVGVFTLPLAADVHRLVHPHGEHAHHDEHAQPEHTGETQIHEAQHWQACAFCECIAPRTAWLFTPAALVLRKQTPATAAIVPYDAMVSATDWRKSRPRAPPQSL